MLKGDLTKFSPGDLLSFLTHLNQEGVLTVSQDSLCLSISFSGGLLTAADSEQADTKVLGALLLEGKINGEQYETLVQARQETGLPLASLLEVAEGIELGDATAIFELGIREVVFQLFTWDRGEFQFNEVPVSTEGVTTAYDCTGLSMDAARQVDEYREFLRGLSVDDLVLTLSESGREGAEISREAGLILEAAAAGRTVLQALGEVPVTSYQAMKALQETVAQKRVVLQPGRQYTPPTAEVPEAERLYLSYKRGVQKLMQADDKRQQISELLGYCRDHFDYFLLIACQGSRIARCRRFQPRLAGQERGVELKDPQVDLSVDPTFDFVRTSRSPFFGKAFESKVLTHLGESAGDGECAIIPLGGNQDESYLLYVRTEENKVTPGALNYLELVSWIIHPPRKDQPRQASEPVARALTPKTEAAKPAANATAADEMVAAVNELPSMPHVVSKVLDLLADPNSQMSEVVKVLSRDPSLVARLIRVSNSALYGRGQETTTLDQAVVRLGANTVRSLVMATSMRSLFPLEKTKVGLWGQTLWQHSIECGLAARSTAQAAGYSDPEEAFVAGVLHDIGKVVILLSRSEEYGRILKEQGSNGAECVQTERSILGFDHSEVGELLLKKWQMPTNLQTSTRHHHTPLDDNEAEGSTLAQIVAIGDLLSHQCGTQPESESFAGLEELEARCRRIGLDEARINTLLEETGAALTHSGLLD